MVVSDETLPMGGTEGSDNEDEHWDDDARAKKQLKEHDREKTGKEGFDWEALMEKYPVLKTREGRAGIVHNFLRGLQLPSTPGPSGKKINVSCTHRSGERYIQRNSFTSILEIL